MPTKTKDLAPDLVADEFKNVCSALADFADAHDVGDLKAVLGDGTSTDLVFDERLIVANAGLLNAGKSSLFNALVGKRNEFSVADARCTIKNREFDHGDFVLVDTPGIDALDTDTAEAHRTLQKADLILFVHSAQNGELDPTEVEFLRVLASYFPDLGDRQRRIIPVLTKADRVRGDLPRIAEKLTAQWAAIFGTEPHRPFHVSEPTFFKGVDENRERLQAVSEVPGLRDHLKGAAEPLRLLKARLFKERATQRLRQLRYALEAEEVRLELIHRKRVAAAEESGRHLRSRAAELQSAITDRYNRYLKLT